MNASLLAIAPPSTEIEWGGTLAIMDWRALFALAGFLLAGLLSVRIVRNPIPLHERHGAAGLVLLGMVPTVFSLCCGLLGVASLVMGELPTPNGIPLTGAAAQVGGVGFLALGATLIGIFAANLRPLAQRRGTGRMRTA